MSQITNDFEYDMRVCMHVGTLREGRLLQEVIEAARSDPLCYAIDTDAESGSLTAIKLFEHRLADNSVDQTNRPAA